MDGRTDGRTDGQKIGRLYHTRLQAGAIKIEWIYEERALNCNLASSMVRTFYELMIAGPTLQNFSQEGASP